MSDHAAAESPTPSLPDQQIIDCYVEGDPDELRALSKNGGGIAAVRNRAKALGLTQGFIKKCRLSGTQAALRGCMKCDAQFLSWGSQNRLCRRCSD